MDMLALTLHRLVEDVEDLKMSLAELKGQSMTGERSLNSLRSNGKSTSISTMTAVSDHELLKQICRREVHEELRALRADMNLSEGHSQQDRRHFPALPSADFGASLRPAQSSAQLSVERGVEQDKISDHYDLEGFKLKLDLWKQEVAFHMTTLEDRVAQFAESVGKTKSPYASEVGTCEKKPGDPSYTSEGSSVKGICEKKPGDPAYPSEGSSVKKKSTIATAATIRTLEVEQTMDLAHDEIEEEFYCMSESVYDCAVLMFSRQVDTEDSVLILLGIGATVSIQISMLVILTHVFIFNPFDPDIGLEAAALMWRREHAHRLENMIIMQNVSLGHAVCNLDSALPVASQQVEFVEALQTYLEPFLGTAIPQGLNMSMIVLVLWISNMLMEISSCCRMIIALLCLPCGWKGQMKVQNLPEDKGYRFKVSYLQAIRLVCLMCLLLVRFSIGTFLCLMGSRWLVQTLKLDEIFLNALSLVLIVEVDDIIGTVLVSLEVKWILANMAPLRGPRFCSLREGRRYYKHSWFPYSMVGVGMSLWLYFFFSFLLPYWDIVQATEEQYCGGSTDYVIWNDTNSGLMRWKPTNPAPQLLNVDPARVAR